MRRVRSAELLGQGQRLVGDSPPLPREGEAVVAVDGGQDEVAPRRLAPGMGRGQQLAATPQRRVEAAEEVDRPGYGQEGARLVHAIGRREARDRRLAGGQAPRRRRADVADLCREGREERGSRLGHVLGRQPLVELRLPVRRSGLERQGDGLLHRQGPVLGRLRAVGVGVVGRREARTLGVRPLVGGSRRLRANAEGREKNAAGIVSATA